MLLGFERQAEPLFDEVVAGDIEHEFYKDAFLDLLYLYGRHMKAGDLEKAVSVCQKASRTRPSRRPRTSRSGICGPNS